MGSLRSLLTDAKMDKKFDTSDFWRFILLVVKERLSEEFSLSFNIKRYFFDRSCSVRQHYIRYHRGKHDPPIGEVYKVIEDELDKQNISNVRPHIFKNKKRRGGFIDIR